MGRKVSGTASFIIFLVILCSLALCSSLFTEFLNTLWQTWQVDGCCGACILMKCLLAWSLLAVWYPQRIQTYFPSYFPIQSPSCSEEKKSALLSVFWGKGWRYMCLVHSSPHHSFCYLMLSRSVLVSEEWVFKDFQTNMTGSRPLREMSNSKMSLGIPLEVGLVPTSDAHKLAIVLSDPVGFLFWRKKPGCQISSGMPKTSFSSERHFSSQIISLCQ